MRVQIPPLERSLRTLTSRHSSSPRPVDTSRRMPRGTTSCHDVPSGTSRAFLFVAVNQFKLANAGGTTWCRGFDSRLAQAGSSAGRAQTVPQKFVVSNKTRPANAGGTTGQSACFKQEVGGPTPPPGNRIAQGNVSSHLVAGTDIAEIMANAGGTIWHARNAGSIPADPARHQPIGSSSRGAGHGPLSHQYLVARYRRHSKKSNRRS